MLLRRCMFIVLLAALGGPAPAAADVFTAGNSTTGVGYYMSSVDGSGRVPVGACVGDFSHQGEPRHFVRLVEGQIVADREDCSAPRVLGGGELDIVRGGHPRWAPDGSAIAYTATETTPLGPVHGLYVASVAYDAGGDPVALFGEHRIAKVTHLHVQISWDRLSRQVAYNDDDGIEATTVDVVWIAAADGSGTRSLGRTGYYPEFSPVADRLLLIRQNGKGGPVRTDIFVVDLLRNTEVQITNKSNANYGSIVTPEWSPDGRQIAFSGLPGSNIGAVRDIARIASTGSGKSVSLTADSNDHWVGPQWRR